MTMFSIIYNIVHKGRYKAKPLLGDRNYLKVFMFTRVPTLVAKLGPYMIGKIIYVCRTVFGSPVGVPNSQVSLY